MSVGFALRKSALIDDCPAGNKTNLFPKECLQNALRLVILIAASFCLFALRRSLHEDDAAFQFALLISFAASSTRAAEVARLAAENWDELASAGKEVECIYGDDVLRNDKIIVASSGAGSQLGRIRGPVWGEKPPVALSIPISVDVDGEGVKPSGNLLDVPLPLSNMLRHAVLLRYVLVYRSPYGKCRREGVEKLINGI